MATANPVQASGVALASRRTNRIRIASNFAANVLGHWICLGQEFLVKLVHDILSSVTIPNTTNHPITAILFSKRFVQPRGTQGGHMQEEADIA